MSTGRRVDRKGSVPKGVLRSLRESYAAANRQASSLVNVYAKNPAALIDLQGEIERGSDRGNAIAIRAQDRAAEEAR